jgi:hypothetical protein
MILPLFVCGDIFTDYLSLDKTPPPALKIGNKEKTISVERERGRATRFSAPIPCPRVGEAVDSLVQFPVAQLLLFIDERSGLSPHA